LIRITDRTLSCLDNFSRDRLALVSFLNLLIELNPGTIELSEKMYDCLSPLPKYPSYVLRIEKTSHAKKYPQITEFVCPNARTDNADERIRTAIQLSDTRKACAKTIARYARYAKVRIQGLDDAMHGDYMSVFKFLKESFNGDIEFCPQDRFYCATALAAQWLTSGTGNNVVTSFAGIGGFAPTEELIMILRENRLLGEGKTYAYFPQMVRLFQRITKDFVPENKPVIGSRIFHVESGVHVDGILKHPQCYEPFPPEIVGQKRRIVLGKQSGTASIRAKLSELNVECPQEHIPLILEQVKTKAVEKNGAVRDWEFVKIAKECQP